MSCCWAATAGWLITLMTPCRASEPCKTVPGPRNTSIRWACSVLISNSWFTLQKPVARTGTPSSATVKAPQLPAPVKTGERMAVRCSWPLPRLIHTPGTRARVSLICTADICSSSSPEITDKLAALSVRFCWVRVAVTMVVSIVVSILFLVSAWRGRARFVISKTARLVLVSSFNICIDSLYELKEANGCTL